METYIPTKPEIISSTSQEELNPLYKVYVGFEKNRNGTISSIEIIDGYLKSNESLELNSTCDFADKDLSVFEINIVRGTKINTYLKIPIQQALRNKILVKINKDKNCVGYQFTDLEGTILSTPKINFISTKNLILG